MSRSCSANRSDQVAVTMVLNTSYEPFEFWASRTAQLPSPTAACHTPRPGFPSLSSCRCPVWQGRQLPLSQQGPHSSPLSQILQRQTDPRSLQPRERSGSDMITMPLLDTSGEDETAQPVASAPNQCGLWKVHWHLSLRFPICKMGIITPTLSKARAQSLSASFLCSPEKS